MMGTLGGLPFLCLGFICLFKQALFIQGSTFCSASIEDTNLRCTNTSVIFVHKLLSHEINDHHPNCLKELKVMCNMEKSCSIPTVCRQLPQDTYIAYGCVPEASKRIQCSDNKVPMLLTHRAFLVSHSYPRILNLWGKRCLWRIKSSVNGTISIYILDLSEKPDLIIHSYPLSSVAGRKTLNTKALSINITSEQTLDLSLQPISKVWMAIELGEVSDKNITLRDHFFCRPPPNYNDKFRTLCGSCTSNLAGMRIALIVMSCIILVLIGCLCIIIHCYCKKFKSFDSTQRPAEPSRQRQTSAVTPYHTTLVQPLMSGQHVNGVSETNKFKKPYKEHTYDHLNNFQSVNYNLNNPQTVKVDPYKQKPFRKRSCEDDDSDSTYATVGENT